jgi:hypothetical protein
LAALSRMPAINATLPVARLRGQGSWGTKGPFDRIAELATLDLPRWRIASSQSQVHGELDGHSSPDGREHPSERKKDVFCLGYHSRPSFWWLCTVTPLCAATGSSDLGMRDFRMAVLAAVLDVLFKYASARASYPRPRNET